MAATSVSRLNIDGAFFQSQGYYDVKDLWNKLAGVGTEDGGTFEDFLEKLDDHGRLQIENADVQTLNGILQSFLNK